MAAGRDSDCMRGSRSGLSSPKGGPDADEDTVWETRDDTGEETGEWERTLAAIWERPWSIFVLMAANCDITEDGSSASKRTVFLRSEGKELEGEVERSEEEFERSEIYLLALSRSLRAFKILSQLVSVERLL